MNALNLAFACTWVVLAVCAFHLVRTRISLNRELRNIDR
ncbi:CcmD family protein [Methanolobus sp.]